MTFEEFQNSRRYVPDLAKVIDYENVSVQPGFVYADSFYIEIQKHNFDTWKRPKYAFYLIIGTTELESNDLNELENQLWELFAKGEINS